jgi:tRNA dimethylallyltransferase
MERFMTTIANQSRSNCPTLLVILGPTASGKTRLAVAAARELGGEIISADSRQVFREMDIGTGKDLVEYGEVPHHLIDILEPGAEFSLYAFQRHFADAFARIVERGNQPILVGGTGLYLDSVLREYRLETVPENSELRASLETCSDSELRRKLCALRPEQHNSTDLLQRSRLIRALEIAVHEKNNPASGEFTLPLFRPLVFGISLERGELRRRITARLRERLAGGMIGEVEALLAKGVGMERLEAYGLEYRYICRYLHGELNRNDLFQKLNGAIHEFAKKQESWFRRMERHGVVITWLNGAADPLAELLEKIPKS